MKNRKNKLYTIMITATLFLSQSMTVFAVTESDVEAVGKETAAGNVFIWFLCAIAFLKISQKIDSFLSSLGINVGHTGGNMLAELMVAARGLTTAKNIAGGSSFGAVLSEWAEVQAASASPPSCQAGLPVPWDASLPRAPCTP